MRLFVSGIHRKADREKPHLTINQSVLHPFCYPAPWPRHAAGGGLAAPRHGLPETDLVESGMTGSWRW
ncbi:hypothetical protein F0L67_04830 [Escherichia coli]|nr:hypothetical protein F0L67_04830 [Escherichia coli]